MKKISLMIILILAMVLVGCHSEKNITITLNHDIPTVEDSIIGKSNFEVTLPSLTKAGYTFTHWFDLKGNKYYTSASFTADITLYPNWEPNKYTVKFIDYDNSVLSVQSINYKGKANKPTDPTRDGYVFVGWDNTFSEVIRDANINALYEKATSGLVYQLETDGYAIIGYHGSSKDIVIPSHYNGYSVTQIASEAFQKQPITSVSLPETITLIGERAFFECSYLYSINIPNSVTEIKEGAFMNCTSLQSITLPTPIIGKSTFYNCSSLSTIIIQNSVTTLSDSAFYNCSQLLSLYIPNSVTTIGANVISWCQNLEYIYTTSDNLDKLSKMFNDAGFIYASKVKFVAK